MKRTSHEIFSTEIGDMTFTVFLSEAGAEPLHRDVIDSHFHTAYELQYLCKGSVVISGEKGDFRAKRGDFVIIPPGTFHHNENAEDLFRYTFLFSLTASDRKHSAFSEYCHYNRILESLDGITVFSSPRGEDGVKRLLELDQHDAAYRHLYDLCLPLLLTDVLSSLEALRKPLSDSRFPEGRSLSREEERMKFIMENCLQEYFASENISDAMAEALGMSGRNCARVVQRLLGKNLSRLVLEQRMNMAKTLICRTDSPLGHISESVGYRSYVSFFTAFKKFYGVSPQQIRDEKNPSA